MTFSERMKTLVDQGMAKAQDLGEKGYAASKQFAVKAGAKAQELGEKGMLMLDVKQLEGQAEKLITRLGSEAYRAFAERGVTALPADDPAVKPILDEIEQIKTTIEEKEAAIQTKR